MNCAVSHPSGKYIAVATDSTIIPVIGNEIFGYSSSFDSIKETFHPRSQHSDVKEFQLSDKKTAKMVQRKNIQARGVVRYQQRNVLERMQRLIQSFA